LLGCCWVDPSRVGQVAALVYFFFFFLFLFSILKFDCLETFLFWFCLILNFVEVLKLCQSILANQSVLFGEV
jgi:hypothetical protein